VTRLNLSVTSTQVSVVSKTRIGSGYAHRPNAAAVVVGPTGLAYDPDHDTLYVASTGDNEIFAIGNAAERSSSAGTGFMVFEDQNHLHGPLGLVLAPNGNLITANATRLNPGGTPNELVEFTPQGRLVAEYEMDAGAPGGTFGIASIVSQALSASPPWMTISIRSRFGTFARSSKPGYVGTQLPDPRCGVGPFAGKKHSG